ncbi:MAG: hypothetical protein JFT09_05705 [Muribaculaceae bacterium]|nr:hypothetical protein [Muribaculaceae bacterium]
MTLIVINISFRGPADTVHSEMTAFVHWLQQTAKINGFLHFADESHGPLTTDQVHLTSSLSETQKQSYLIFNKIQYLKGDLG